MNGEPKFRDDLEDLLSTAQLEAGQRTKRNRAAAGSMYVPQNQRARFTDPASWSLVGQTQLVHAEGSVHTLIGLFDEYRHIDRADARKLVAADRINPTMNPKVEYVTGDSWLGRTQLEARRKTPDRKIQLVEDLILDMGVSAPAVVLEISLVGGGVSRAVLTQTTRFESFTPRTILSLPAGLDILEGLTRGTKERIWQEVQKVLGAGDSLTTPEEE